jgi:hypothetical protein
MLLKVIISLLYTAVPAAVVASFVVPIGQAIAFGIALPIVEIIVAYVVRIITAPVQNRLKPKNVSWNQLSVKARRLYLAYSAFYGFLSSILIVLIVVIYNVKLLLAAAVGITFKIILMRNSYKRSRSPSSQ